MVRGIWCYTNGARDFGLKAGEIGLPATKWDLSHLNCYGWNVCVSLKVMLQPPNLPNVTVFVGENLGG